MLLLRIPLCPGVSHGRKRDTTDSRMEDHATASGQDGNCDFHSVFHSGHNEVLFFPDLRIASQQQLLAACVVVFLMALLNEGLRLFVSWLQGQVNNAPQPAPQPLGQPVWALGVVHTFSYVLHLFVHYCLMLIFMTLNVWLCLALLLGAGAGFVLFHFRPVKSRVFRFFGVRERGPRQGKEEEEEKETYSEMTDITGSEHAEDYRWNGVLKEK